MSGTYGVMAELAGADALLDAARRTQAAGFREIEAYSPFPVEGLAEAVGMRSNAVALITLAGGAAGCIGSYLMQWYAAVISYPFNIGGRPLDSWPAFVPATFELTVLAGVLSALVGMLVANGLPKLRHPAFNAPDFDLASRDRFFLFILASDPKYPEAGEFLRALAPLRVDEVPA